ncbi:YceD family protein [Sphingobium nicotianae]|nr:DUF177 domain-containing protein [Sphingobium nicotianae]
MNQLGDGSREREIGATPEERTALARRFGLRALDRLEARLHVVPEAGGALLSGTLIADLVQACVATDEDVPAHLDVPFTVRFVRGLDASASDEEGEVELSDEDLDLLPLEDERIDLGETVAQTLALNLDPYPRVAGADAILREMGVLSEEEAGPFAALKGLKLGKGES